MSAKGKDNFYDGKRFYDQSDVSFLYENNLRRKSKEDEEVEEGNDAETVKCPKNKAGYIKLPDKTIIENIKLLQRSCFATLMVLCAFVCRTSKRDWMTEQYRNGKLICMLGIKDIVKYAQKSKAAVVKDLALLEKTGMIQKVLYNGQFYYCIGYRKKPEIGPLKDHFFFEDNLFREE